MNDQRQFLGTRLISGAAGLCLPIAAAAFNLGDVQVRSSLGAPLDLVIPVELHRNDQTGDYLRAALADWRDYEDAGIPEVFDRTEATITIEQGVDGSPRIRLQTKRPVLEPLVPVLLDARLGSVMVRRSYSVLLDPPTAPAQRAAPPAESGGFGPRATAPIETTPLASARIPATRSSRTLVRGPRRPIPPMPRAPDPTPDRRAIPLTDIRVVVQPGETLGELSQRIRRNPNTPLRRMMQDVYAANPQAFGGRPGLLWAGSEIRVPLEDGLPEGLAVRRTPLPTAIESIAARPTVLALRRLGGKLSTQLSSLPTSAQIADASLSQLWMPAAKFPASRLSVVLAELPAAPAIPEPTVATVELAEDSRLSDTSADSASFGAAAATSLPIADASANVPSTGGASGGFWRTSIGLAMLFVLAWLIWIRRNDAVRQARPATAPAPRKLPPVSKNVRPVELNPKREAEAQVEARILAVAGASKPAPKAAPAPKPEPEPLDFNLDAAANEATATPEPAAREPAQGPAQEPAPEPKQAAASKVVAMPGAHRRDDRIEVVESQLPESTGGLSGFYADVAQMLTSALESNPKRRDVRLKLLEVYFAAGMADEFLSNTRQYLEMLKGQNDEYWPEIAEMGRQLFPQHEWFSVATPPVLGDGAADGKPAKEAARNFNRYYEGVDQWKLRGALEELAQQYRKHGNDPSFITLKQDLLQQYAGRPSPLVHAAALSVAQGGAQIYLKREARHGNGHDHLINAVGQIALARQMGRKGVVTATTNGLHGLATAVIARAQSLQCRVFIDELDARAHHARVLRMKEFGAEIEEVRDKNVPDVDARRTAMTEWLENPKEFLYVTSLASGPHPYPTIMHENLALVGKEAREQIKLYSQRPPTAIVAGTTDGPAAIGMIQAFLDETQTRLYCADIIGQPAKFVDRLVGSPANSLREHDWPREHAWLRDTRRVQYTEVSELEANRAISAMYEHERLMLSRDGAQTVAYALRIARELTPDHSVVVLLPSQNDADAHFVESRLDTPGQAGTHSA